MSSPSRTASPLFASVGLVACAACALMLTGAGTAFAQETLGWGVEIVPVGEELVSRGVRIAGQGVANPLATILSVAMMLRYSLDEADMADRIETAVRNVLDQGLRTQDIYSQGMRKVGTSEMGDVVVAALRT